MTKQNTKIITIEPHILTIRGVKVMLDSDLAALYEVPTKRLNEAVKRNNKRFPKDFMFRLTSNEWESLRSQFATSNGRGGRQVAPYVFTEHGVAMLSSVLNSEKAIQINIQIMRAFIAVRQYALALKTDNIPQRLEELKQELVDYIEKNDKRVDEVITVINALNKMLLNDQKKKTKRIGFVK